MATFVRLLGWLRPYRRGVLLSGLLAGAAMTMTVAIPWLTGRAIDRVRAGDKAGLTTLGLAVLAAGVLRLGLTVTRRLLAGRVSLGVELDLRNRMYGHLQALELGFFDGQQTGQLMSRATVDLQAVRFFLGYGLVFILQSALTILLAGVAMFAVQPGLAAVSLIPVPIVVFVSARYGRRSRPALQELQQRIAELTADVEENIGGVRVVKAFAREDRQLERFRGRVGRVWDQAMVSTRMQAFYNPFIGFLPQLGLATILFYGGRQVIDGRLTIGEFSAFYASEPPRRVPASTRSSTASRASPRRPTRPGFRPAPGTWSCTGCRCSTRAPPGPCSTTSTSTCPPGPRSPSWAPPARARRRSCNCSRACTTSAPARC
jgi:ATP-binding cassette subfamily B protein